jgi:NADPH2:quinone reductase
VQEEVRRLTGGHGVDVTIDNVGASAIQGCIEAAALLGRVVQVGRLGGRHGTIDLDELARKRLSIIGVTFRTRTPEERTAVVRAALDDIGEALASGAFRPPVHATYPLAEAAGGPGRPRPRRAPREARPRPLTRRCCGVDVRR